MVNALSVNGCLPNHVLTKGNLVLTSEVDNFEKSICKFTKSKYCLTLNSGTDALMMSLYSLGIKKGDEVIICSGTCSVMVNAILKLNAVPIFSDICEYTMGSDLNGIKNKITSKTKLIVAQHNFGIPCSIVEIKSFCNLNNIFLLEDCALSLGSKYNGINVGTFGDASSISFYPAKILGCFGDGGIILTSNKFMAKKCDQNKIIKALSVNKLPRASKPR